ncbi:hypothetical protein LAZ67_X000792 [Cordylochernes scorpioides]|uniref:Uncharacterized protein n=1 Tax=Cordylochernes scorpioides TaxID=51811 RepID=A0ABY6LUJ4_9ARAC|nr:hypothetical protein LAZ67_X000792 [Cordylochernes scorpioides]
MGSSACDLRVVTNSSIRPLFSDGNASFSRKRSCSPSNRRTTLKTKGSGPLRLLECRTSSNNAIIRTRQWYRPGFTPVTKSLVFKDQRGQNQPRSVPPRHSRDRRTTVDSTALWRCGLDIPRELAKYPILMNQEKLTTYAFRAVVPRQRHNTTMLASFSRVECRGDESTPGPPLCTGGYPQVFPGRIFEDSPLGYGALFVFVHSRSSASL